MKTARAPSASKFLWDTKQSDDWALSNIQILTSGKIRFNVRDTVAAGADEISGGTFDSTGTVTNNNWHFITTVWDTTNDAAYIYIDGTLDASATGLTLIGAVTDTNTATIGANRDSAVPNGSDFFPGLIDEVRLYNLALTAAEIQEIYLAGKRD